ncbi:hypothetical protein KHA94_22810 [Bacillus sp. FJAT-49705]|uniref:Uncharacterized protein n=2 Tax=Cytobacillus citreus TaxID=2833586 RepID=A0ABS5NYQ1_9BACI|nr:hypothetical protein [Cytobacillus citreus]
MEWALAILFIAAVSLLILSFYKTGQSSTRLEQQLDQLTFSFKDDIDQLQQQIRNFELDAEIAAREAGIQADSKEQRLLLREMLDMHRRGYSFESISTKNQLTKEEVEHILAPYIKTKDERSKVANES